MVKRIVPAPIYYIDYGNKTTLVEELKDKGYEVHVTRFYNNFEDTLVRIHNKISQPSWVISSLNDYNNMDFLWHPSKWDEENIHKWASQHQKNGGTYWLPVKTNFIPEVKYNSSLFLRKVNPYPIIMIDYDNADAVQLDQEYTTTRFFGTMKETLSRIKAKITGPTWVISSLNDYSNFDFTWHPSETQINMTHIWPSQHQENGGTYLFQLTTDSVVYEDTLVPRIHVPPIEFVDYGNEKADIKFGVIQLANPDVYQTRFVNSEWETLKRIHTNCLVPKWVVNSLSDYTDFDFTWHPNEFEADVIQSYPSQHQISGGTYYLPKFEYNKAFSTNFKKHIVPRTEKANTVWIDFGNNLGRVVPISDTGKIDEQTRFIDSYYGTLKRVLRTMSTNVWVISSMCDYEDFDFTWHPDISQDKMLHVFPSGDQKYGDTFYINVQEFQKQQEKIKKLEWFEINFIKDKTVNRYPLEVIKHEYDSQVDAIKTIDFHGPLALYSNGPESCLETLTVSLWRPETRAVVPLNKGGTCVIVPRDARNEIKHQVYDYQYIDKVHRDQPEYPLDIVFIDNQESNADAHYNRLAESVIGLSNKLHRVSNVDGRLASMRAAAAVAETPWYFVVNAKLKVDKDFDWNWQPDRLQEQKHYIFYADNPYTGDRYGHMAIVAHNKKLVNTDVEWGLDFVMSYKTAVVPILSGVAEYADNPWDAWRTAFRETLKLIVANSASPEIETGIRIEKWLAVEEEWNSKGANDAQTFYNLVKGDLEEVQKSYEWKWLKEYFNSHYA